MTPDHIKAKIARNAREVEEPDGNVWKDLLVVAVVLLGVHLFCSPARAGTLGVHVASAHVPADSRLNSLNLGVMYRHESGLQVGYFRNSLDRDSVYGAYHFQVLPAAGGSFDLAVGAVSGYERKCRPTSDWYPADGIYIRDRHCEGNSRHRWTPMVVPSYAFPPVEGVVPRVSLVVAAPSAAIHLSLERSL